MESKICLVKLPCPLCGNKDAQVFHSKSKSRSLYIRCSDCNAIIFGHFAVVRCINNALKGYKKVRFEGITQKEWEESFR